MNSRCKVWCKTQEGNVSPSEWLIQEASLRGVPFMFLTEITVIQS